MDTYELNLKRIRDIAAERGLTLNHDRERLKKVVGLMAANYDLTGQWFCPCKQQHRPPLAGADPCCPCRELEDEIAADGHCRCRVFYLHENPVPKTGE